MIEIDKPTIKMEISEDSYGKFVCEPLACSMSSPQFLGFAMM